MTAAFNKFFINGEWVEPSTSDTLDVINPATEESIGKIAMGGAEDVDRGKPDPEIYLLVAEALLLTEADQADQAAAAIESVGEPWFSSRFEGMPWVHMAEIVVAGHRMSPDAADAQSRRSRS